MNQATQMGAIFKADLRSDVTHLVVGNVNTPKYQYAAQNRFDLKIMDLNWVKDAFEKWVEGEDVNFDAVFPSVLSLTS
jgi:DNA replication regulator DPB11